MTLRWPSREVTARSCLVYDVESAHDISDIFSLRIQEERTASMAVALGEPAQQSGGPAERHERRSEEEDLTRRFTQHRYSVSFPQPRYSVHFRSLARETGVRSTA